MSPSPSDDLAPETLELLFELTRGAPDRQIDTGDAHDDKAFRLLAAGSVLVGFLTLAHDPPNRLVWAMLAAYGVVVLGVVWCVRPRSYRASRHADVLWKEHWHSTPRQIQHAIVADAAAGYAANKETLTSKLRGVYVAIVGLAAEAASLALIVLDTTA